MRCTSGNHLLDGSVIEGIWTTVYMMLTR